MTPKFTYCSEVMPIEQDTNLQWVHALSIGEYKHPTYGELKFTSDRIRRFVDSVKNKVRGIDPDIDYDHKRDVAKGMSAAGWVRDAEERENGLWLLVEWTKKAAQAIKDREYRYFSTEFVDEWEDSKGAKFKDVVFGGSLTNRPFLKDLEPVNLSELADSTKENIMELAELARILGLSEDASEDDVKAKLSELAGSATLDLSKLSVTESDGKLTVTHPDVDGEFVHAMTPPAPPKEEEDEKELAKLAETNPVIAKILSENKTMKDDVNELKAQARLSEVTTQLSELGDEFKAALPPVVQKKMAPIMVQLPKKFSDDIAEVLKELIKVGVVSLSEQGRSKSSNNDDDDVTKYLSEISRLRKENDKLSTRDAADIVRRENPELHQAYTEAVRLGEEA